MVTAGEQAEEHQASTCLLGLQAPDLDAACSSSHKHELQGCRPSTAQRQKGVPLAAEYICHQGSHNKPRQLCSGCDEDLCHLSGRQPQALVLAACCCTAGGMQLQTIDPDSLSSVADAAARDIAAHHAFTT